MKNNYTLEYLKKRILDVLGEYYTAENAVFVSDGNRDILKKRMPDVISSSLIRLYEGTSVAGDGRSVLAISDMAEKRLAALCEGNTVSFNAPASPVVLSVTYFGSGKATVEDADGTQTDEITCQGGTGLTLGICEFVPEREGRCRVVFSPELGVQSVAVYLKDTVTEAGMYAPDGCVSIKLPNDFSRFNRVEVGKSVRRLSEICIKDGFAYISREECNGERTATVSYKIKAPSIDEDTADDFVLELHPVAFEALVCLAASELCREEDTSVYTRLLYKYNDLYEGLCGMAFSENGRNTFYKGNAVRRW